MRKSDYIFPVALAALMYVLSFGLFADLAINGALATPGKTFAALAIVGVSLIAATATLAAVAIDVRENRLYAELTAANDARRLAASQPVGW